MIETKILINSVISQAKQGTTFLSCDLKEFFLATPMLKPEYMKIHNKNIPQDIRDHYELDKLLSDDGYIYCKIKKRMYGLKQATILSFDNLFKKLSSHGYAPVPNTIRIWHHATRKQSSVYVWTILV